MLKHDRKVHTGVKDYECRVCEAEVTDIQIHMRVSGEVIWRENLRQLLKTKKLSLLTDRVEVMENARHKLFSSSFPLLKKRKRSPIKSKVSSGSAYFQVHKAEKQFECPVCPMTFRHKNCNPSIPVKNSILEKKYIQITLSYYVSSNFIFLSNVLL